MWPYLYAQFQDLINVPRIKIYLAVYSPAFPIANGSDQPEINACNF